MKSFSERLSFKTQGRRNQVGALALQALALGVMLSGCLGEPETTPVPTLQASPTTAISEPAPASPTAMPSPDVSPTAVPAESVPTATTSTTVQAAEPDVGGLPGVSQEADCLDQAVFIKDVTIPDGAFFDPGESVVKTWRVRNTGTCQWGSGYALVFADGDIMNGALTNPMPVIPAGEIADVSVELTASARGGPQKGYWKFQNAAGAQFGTGMPSTGLLWVEIIVDYFPSNPSPAPASVGTSDTPGSGECAVQRNPGYENEILTLIKQARAAGGVGFVEQQDQLSAAALAHSTDMACKGFVDHNGSDGSTWYDRVAAQGYANYASARENIYVGDPAFGGTARGAFDWWMNSQVHRDNILFANVSEVGIGYVYLAGSPYGGYYTLVLARP